MNPLNPFETPLPHTNQVYVLTNQPPETTEDMSGTVYKPRRDFWDLHRRSFEAAKAGGAGQGEDLSDPIFRAAGLDRNLTTYVLTGVGGHGLAPLFTLYGLSLQGVVAPYMGAFLAGLEPLTGEAVIHSLWQRKYGAASDDIVVLSLSSGRAATLLEATSLMEAMANPNERDRSRFLTGVVDQLKAAQPPSTAGHDEEPAEVHNTTL